MKFDIDKSIKRILKSKSLDSSIIPNKILNKQLNIPKLMTGFTNTKRIDKDGDGIPNWKDCQPNNMFRQDSKPNRLMMERIRRLPLFYYAADKTIPISKVSTSRQKYAMRVLYKTFKKRPDLIGEIERRKDKVFISITGDKAVHKNLLKVGKSRVVGGTYPIYDEETGKVGKASIIISAESPRPVTMFHEIKHTDQLVGMPITEHKKMLEKGPESKEERGKLLKTEKYHTIPTEYEAEKYAMEKVHEGFKGYNFTDEEKNKLAEGIMKLKMGEITGDEYKEEYVKKIVYKVKDRGKREVRSFMSRL